MSHENINLRYPSFKKNQIDEFCYKLFSIFLQRFECFYIRLFSRLALMCEMENATVTTCKVARVNSAIEAIDTRNVNKNNLLSKDIIAINGPNVH